MLKNPKSKSYLLPVVAGIWLLVIFRYLGYFDSKADAGVQPSIKQSTVPVSFDSNKDTFHLTLDYRDPFLGGVSKNQPKSINTNPVVESTPKIMKTDPPKIAPDLLQIKYSGIVQESGSGHHVGLLRVNGNSKYVEPGTNFAGFDVIKIFPDSIWLKSNGKNLTIVR